MKNVQHFITNLDASPVSYSVTFNRKTQYQTFICGVLSAVLWIVIILISIDKLVSILGRQEMYLSSIEQRSWTSVQMTDLNLNIIVQITDTNTIITKENQFQYGLNLTYSTYYQPQNGSLSVQNFPLANQSYIFVFPQEFEPKIEGSTDTREDEMAERYFQIQIRFCDEGNPACQKIKTQSHLNVKITWDRPLINLQRGSNQVQMSGVEDFRTIQLSSLVEKERRKIFYIEGVTLNLDQSVFPSILLNSQQKIDTWYYDFKTGYEELNLVEKQKILQTYSFRRDDLTTHYQRSYKKIDTGIAEVLGIFSLVTLILMVFSSHYKNWAKNILLSEDIEKKEIREVNMKNYIKYIRNKENENAQLDREIEQSLNRLDIVKLREDIDRLDEKIHLICEKSGIPNERISQKEVVQMRESSEKIGKKEALKQSLLGEKQK